jgi:phosphoglycerate kinase
LKEITQADIKGKRVLVRVGFDVPIEDGRITDDSRIQASIPTIKYLEENGASEIFLVTHRGRPQGKETEEFRLQPVAEKLAQILGSKITKENIENSKVDFSWEAYRFEPNIIMFENIRFDPGEENDSDDLAKKLANLADLYVNDAFSVSHRHNASVSAITKFLPSYAGLSLIKEISELDKLVKKPAQPFGVIIGGAKTEDKLPAVKNLSTLADFFLLGGVVANTFLAARRHKLGKSLYDRGQVKDAQKIWTQIMDDPARDIFLPRDFVVSKSIKNAADMKIISIKDVGQIKDSEYAIVDIGPKTIELYKSKINDAKTIFWNGNLGVTEISEFAEGSEEIARAIAEVDSYSVIGGGDTAGFVYQQKLDKKIDFISTGGGATLEYLAGKMLPGLNVLN